MDIVIPVRVSNDNPQLRYALRSFEANLPHDQVWIVGHKPPWLRGVNHIRTVQRGTKYANTTLAVRTACQHPGVSEEFIFANDDMFVMTAVDGRLPAYHRGPMIDLEQYLDRKYRGRGGYIKGLRGTRQLLEGLGHAKPLSYEVHVPIVINKTRMLDVLDLGRNIPALHKRTAYAVINQIGGTRLRDPKVLNMGAFPRDAQFLSTMPNTFRRGAVGQHIRRTFPQQGAYEQPRVQRGQPRRSVMAGLG